MRLYIKNNILNLIAVAAYHSNRFNNSEEFIKKTRLKSTILFLKDKTPDDIIDVFFKKMDIKIDADKTSFISVSDIIFLWKLFIVEKNYPNIMYFNTLICCLKEKYTFKDNKFYGLTNHTVDKLKNINIFWKKCMKYDKTDKTELSEITEYFNDWVENKTESADYFVDEKILTGYLIYTHDIHILHIHGKNIIRYSYLTWDKQCETDTLFEIIKTKYKQKSSEFETSIDNCYTDYCKECAKENNKKYKIVSKSWFEKYIYQIIPEQYIVKKRILNEYWNH
jgi:hypothetical protein